MVMYFVSAGVDRIIIMIINSNSGRPCAWHTLRFCRCYAGYGIGFLSLV